MKMKQKKNAQIGAIAMDEHKMHIYLSHPNANAYLMYIVVVQMHTCTLASVWCDERPSRIEITNTQRVSKQTIAAAYRSDMCVFVC